MNADEIAAVIFAFDTVASVALHLVEQFVGDVGSGGDGYVSIERGLFRRSFHGVALNNFFFKHPDGEADKP